MKIKTHLSICAGVLIGAIASSSVWADKTTLFKYKGTNYQSDEFSNTLRQSLFQIESESYQRKVHLAESMLLELYLNSEAKRLGQSTEQVTEGLLGTPHPDEVAMKQFYDQNKARIGAPYEQVKTRIAQHLTNSQIETKRAAIVGKLKNEGSFELLFDAPVSPKMDIVTEGYPYKGNANASVTIVEFADYQCPHCRKVSFELKKLMQKYASKVKLVFRDFPINQSGISKRVAEGAVCADQQGVFWDYHDMAFELQSGLNDNSPIEFADILGIDKMAFANCLDAPATKDKVAQSTAEGKDLQINATPTLYINGHFLYDHDHNVDLAAEIEKAIAAQK